MAEYYHRKKRTQCVKIILATGYALRIFRVSANYATMKTETAIITAAVLGTIAFNEGRSAVPAHDPELLKVIGQHEKKEMGASIPILKAWIASWHAANLAQPA